MINYMTQLELILEWIHLLRLQEAPLNSDDSVLVTKFPQYWTYIHIKDSNVRINNIINIY